MTEQILGIADGSAEGQSCTAVVVVHGMGEQRPLETINGFVQTGLKPFGDPTDPKARARVYYSRPTVLTKSFEARRLLAIERVGGGLIEQAQTEFFEYHWSYRMKGNKIGDLGPTVARLMCRPIWRVPAPMRVLWAILWVTVVGFGWYVLYLFEHKKIDALSVRAIAAAMIPNAAMATALVIAVVGISGWLTSTFVDVVRYLDTSPRSYEVREAIRGGMVDLLKALHACGRYSRVVVVAHSLGGFIAYDAMNSLWNQTARGSTTFDGLAALEAAANALPPRETAQPTPDQLSTYMAAQFELWQELQRKGIDWRITDFVSIGTPMYFADLLYTKNRIQFKRLCKRAELPQCPPQSDTQTVEGAIPNKIRYGWRDQSVLVTGSPYAFVRWTNLWFPTECGVFGDWFGGPLRPLFGAGIYDQPINGNKPWRLIPAWSHTRYFHYPNSNHPNDIAPAIQKAIALETLVKKSDQANDRSADPKSGISDAVSELGVDIEGK